MFLARKISLNRIPGSFVKAQGSGSVVIVALTFRVCSIFQPCYHHVCSFNLFCFVFLCLLQHWFLSWGRKVSMEGSSTRKHFRWLTTWGSLDTKAACTQPPSSSPLPPCCISLLPVLVGSYFVFLLLPSLLPFCYFIFCCHLPLTYISPEQTCAVYSNPLKRS